MHLGLGIKTGLNIIIDRIIVFFGKIIQYLVDRYRLALLRKNENIILGHNIKISNSAEIRIVGGGSISIGDNTEILDGVLILTYGGNIKIGKNCSINAYTIIYGHGNTEIGNDVLIAGHSMIIPNNHNFENINENINKQGSTSKGIVIENNVWIAHGCSILDGVTIKKGSIIAAGSVVNKSIKENTVVGGIPGKEIKKRDG